MWAALNTGGCAVSIAHMISPRGWHEPGQTTEFDEYMVLGMSRHGAAPTHEENRQHRFQAQTRLTVELCKRKRSATAHGYRHGVPVFEQIVARRGHNLFLHLLVEPAAVLVTGRVVAYGENCRPGLRTPGHVAITGALFSDPLDSSAGHQRNRGQVGLFQEQWQNRRIISRTPAGVFTIGGNERPFRRN